MSDQQPWPAREDIPGNTNQSGHAPRGRDGEVMPWDGRRVEPGGERGRAEVIMRYEPDGGSSKPPGGRKRRSRLVLLLALLLVAILAIVVLVITRPKANSALDKPSPTVSPTSASPSATSPSPSGSSAAPADSSTASPAATGTSGASSSPNSVQAGGGGAGAEVADLSALSPVQTYDISGPNNGPAQIGATVYQNSVGFTCYSGPSYIDYNVAGYKFLNTVIGIPSNASNAAGNSMTVTFFKDGSSTQLGSPVTVSLDHPQSVHLDLAGSSQLEIACTAIGGTSHTTVSMDAALGNATIGPS
jgi:hypothetical protein